MFDIKLKKAPVESDLEFITLLAFKTMNSFLEDAYQGPFDWEKWEFDLRESILVQNQKNGLDLYEIYLIEMNNDKIGFLWISKYSEEILWIDSFIIDPKFQKQGIGKIVFGLLKTKILSLQTNFKFIDLGVQYKNKDALLFYEKLGFGEISDISMSYYKTQRMRYSL